VDGNLNSKFLANGEMKSSFEAVEIRNYRAKMN